MRWKGWGSPAGRIQVRPLPGGENRWSVSGPSPQGNAEARAGDLVMMARAVIRNLETGAGAGKLEWIRE